MRGDKNMGVFETIFRKPKADLKAEGYFKMLNGYTPVFSNAPESIYEMELTRAAIHSFASFASKLKPEISGTAQKNLERTLQFKPNPFMDTSKFIYRIATILSVNNTCFIVPIEDEFGGLIGYYPLLPQRCEVVEYNGAPFLRYTFGSGQKAAIEFERVGVMTQFQYTDDFFGESSARNDRGYPADHGQGCTNHSARYYRASLLRIAVHGSGRRDGARHLAGLSKYVRLA